MIMPLLVQEFRDGSWVTVIGGITPATPVFVPGFTEPFYTLSEDFTGYRNVGVDPGVELTPYTGPTTNGVATLTAGQTYEGLQFNCMINHNGAHVVNSRILIPESFTFPDTSLNAAVRSVNGASTTGGTLDRVEIINRAQRPLNGIIGRNLNIKRVAVAGFVDGFVDSTAGSAPQNFGFNIEDSIVRDVAWFYSPIANTVIHSTDKESHSDAWQKSTTLPSTGKNTVLLGYVSERIGTGTPGSGVEENPYAPASGHNFIVSQAQMEDWRDEFCSHMTDPAQSKYGVAHRLPNGAVNGQGSVAALMVNRDNLTLERMYFGGGLSTINLQDTNLPTAMNVSIKDSKFWNDMKNGHGGNPATKGHAAVVKLGKSLALFTGNQWPDGSPVVLNYA